MPEYISLFSLWLPILLSALIVFIAAALFYMVLPHHKTDWVAVPNEGPLLEAIRGLNLQPGGYVFPRALTPEGMKDPDAKAQLERGPVGHLLLRPTGAPNMGQSMVLYFIFNLVISILVAYVASRTLSAGTEYLQVFRITATVGFLAYGAAEVPGSIWMGHPWSTTLKSVIDSLVFGLLMGGVFGWLWP